MKRILLSMSLAMVCFVMFGQSKRTMLFEEFTQASCPPCEANKPFVNEVVNNNKDKLVQIRYQTSWPGIDPMNADNPTEVAQRVTYYGVGGVPSVHLDGTLPDRVGNYIFPQSAVDARTSVESPVLVEVNHELAEDFKSMTVEVRIINEGENVYNTTSRLRVAIIEQEIRWPFRPGTTSMTEFQGVMKRFINGTNGLAVSAVNPGDTLVFLFENIELPERVYDLRELAVVAFVQNDANKEVVNAALSAPQVLPAWPDMRMVSVTPSTGGLCDLAYTAAVVVSNVGDADSGPFEVALLSNGNPLSVVVDEDGLAAGANRTFNFAGDLLAGGNNLTAVVIYNDNEYAILNNLTGNTLIGKVADTEKIEKTFEQDAIGENPRGTIVNSQFRSSNFVTVNSSFINSTTRPGGFGTSERSVMINFYQWNPASAQADGNMVVAEKLLVKETDVLSFDYAYTTWQGSQDRLRVQISTNCGSTYTTVWDRRGAELRTAPEVNSNNAYYKPLANHWRKIEIPMANYGGQEVVIRFLATSDWGDMLYLDNINVASPNSIADLELIESVDLAPNPAMDFTNLIIRLSESKDVFIKVLDLSGRVLTTDRISGNNGGIINHSINTAALNSGMYLVEINIGAERVVKKLVVTK